MKGTLFVLFTIVLACVVVPARQGTESLKEIVTSYLGIQTSLASDRLEEARTPARGLAADAAELGKDGEAIGSAASALASAGDITTARDAFGTLSDAVIARVQANGSKALMADLRIAYCPMAKRSWLQREEQVRNPYYGTKMLTCGEIKPLPK